MFSQSVLLVHETEERARKYRAWLEEDGFAVSTSLGEDAARAELEKAHALLVVALDLPDGRSLALLEEFRDRGDDTPLLLLTEEGSLPVDVADVALRLEAARLLAEPLSSGEFLDGVWAVLESDAERPVRGHLHDLGFPSLVSILCNEGRRVALRVSHPAGRGTVFFADGHVVHAETDGLVAEEAFYEILTWTEGRFALLPGQIAPVETIHGGWTGLLLEGLRRSEEEAFDQELLPEVPVSTSPLLEGGERHPDFEVGDEVQDQVEGRLARLFQALRPRCVLLVDRSGHLISLHGEVERGRALSLAALVAGSFTATDEIAELLSGPQESSRFHQSLQEGVDVSLYAAQAGPPWILAVAFEPCATRLGLARQFTLQAAADLAALAHEAAAAPKDHREMAGAMDDLFREEVGDALEDLFN
jgi:prepilin-type processing-associated H-X9-DG protein